MKKKVFLLTMLFSLSLSSLNAQTFYYYRGEKINLIVDRNYVHIIADEDFFRHSSSNQQFQLHHLQRDDSRPIQGMVKVRLNSVAEMSEYSKAVESLRKNEQIRYVFPFFERKGAEPIGTSDIFYIRLKNVGDSTLLRKTAERLNVQVLRQIPYMPLWYVLSLKNSTFNNSIEVTNYFFETGLFEEVDPAFMFNFRPSCTNDPMFDQLWGLKNATNPGIDINVCNAWTITRGAGINVAVVDQKIYPNHEDLSINLHTLSFNTQPYLEPCYSFPHGTMVAGVIAAVKNNGLQLVGVAPESKIMNVINALNPSSSPTYPNSTIAEEKASGISWAWQNGADVINNSWGDFGGHFYNDLKSVVLEDAILDALTQGRNGKGSVVVFASGNSGLSNRVDYPGNFHDDILVVGAMNSNGQRRFDSNHGSKLDIVAPGDNILTTYTSNRVTVASQTSLATPFVSGVAALILSANPNLTGQQVRDIIESTAQKVNEFDLWENPDGYIYTDNLGIRPNGTWNNEMGYGLVDAYAAVKEALATPVITGSSFITPFGTFSTNTGLPASWDATPGFTLEVSDCSTSVTVRPWRFAGRSGTLTAVVDGVTLTKNIQHAFIVGNGVVSASTNFRLNTNQVATWSVTPDFHITTSNVGTSVTVAPVNANSISGIVTATLTDGTTIEKIINTQHNAVMNVTMQLSSNRPAPNFRAVFIPTHTPSGAILPTERNIVEGNFSQPTGHFSNSVEIETGTFFTESLIFLYNDRPQTQRVRYNVTVEVRNHYDDGAIHTQHKTGEVFIDNVDIREIMLLEDGWREPYFGHRTTMTVSVHLNFLDPPLSINEETTIELSIYPNPTFSVLNVKVDDTATLQQSVADYDVRLYDNRGNLMRRSATKDGRVQFNIINLPGGSYFLHVYDSENSVPIKRQVMIER